MPKRKIESKNPKWIKQTTVLSVQDESVDLRHVYLSVAALCGSADFKSLLHYAFNVSPFIQTSCHQWSQERSLGGL